MDNINFLFYDEMELKGRIYFSHLRVLKQNENGTFRLINLPYTINGTLQEFQCEIGPIVYVIDENIDKKLIDKYGATKMNHLEYVSQNSYHVVTGYDKNNICVKNTDIAEPTNEPSLRFVKLDKLTKKPNNKDIVMLKQNNDDTVSIKQAPISIRGNISQYEVSNNCLLVATIGERDLYDEEDIIQLERTDTDGEYSFIKIYEKAKAPKVKRK